jgi:hypothetical protein
MNRSSSNLPVFLQDLLASCPTAGRGVHVWLFGTARALHRHHVEGDDMYRLLEQSVSDCGRFVPPREIEEAIKNSASDGWTPGQNFASGRRKSKWPGRDYALIERIARSGPKLSDLSENMQGIHHHTEEIIDMLFHGNLLLCCGRSVKRFATRPREIWRGELAMMPLIVPSPMSSPTGKTRTGKESARSLTNTGPRRFLVVEFDFVERDHAGQDTDDAPLLRGLAASGIGIPDLCASLHSHLSRFAPLVLALHSGGKSLHGWFYAEQQPEAKLLRFMRYAVAIGADPMTWTRCQFVRTPNAFRDNGKRQQVYYFRPEVLE